MAKKWSNEDLAGALHFVTGNVRDRRRIFTQDRACRIFFEEMQNLGRSIECKLVAFVLMPDHFHLVVNPRSGKIREWVGGLKSVTAKRLVAEFPKDWFVKADGENQVWQESFKALPLWSDWMIWQKSNYVHANPIKAGLAPATGAYKWSSFNSFYDREFGDLVVVDKEWWWPDDVRKLSDSMGKRNEELEEKIKKERGQSHPF